MYPANAQVFAQTYRKILVDARTRQFTFACSFSFPFSLFWVTVSVKAPAQQRVGQLVTVLELVQGS